MLGKGRPGFLVRVAGIMPRQATSRACGARNARAFPQRPALFGHYDTPTETSGRQRLARHCQPRDWILVGMAACQKTLL
jgi:hypothetical protein